MADRRIQPQAVRSALDVYGENARKIIPIDSPQFGLVMAVCVGAMMVGSIRTVVEEGQTVARGDELGYFAFGACPWFVCGSSGMLTSFNVCDRWFDDRRLVREGHGAVGRGPRYQWACVSRDACPCWDGHRAVSESARQSYCYEWKPSQIVIWLC